MVNNHHLQWSIITINQGLMMVSQWFRMANHQVQPLWSSLVDWRRRAGMLGPMAVAMVGWKKGSAVLNHWLTLVTINDRWPSLTLHESLIVISHSPPVFKAPWKSMGNLWTPSAPREVTDALNLEGAASPCHVEEAPQPLGTTGTNHHPLRLEHFSTPERH